MNIARASRKCSGKTIKEVGFWICADCKHVINSHDNNACSECHVAMPKRNCWQCEKDITDEPLPRRFVSSATIPKWTNEHCEECYQMKIRWEEEVR